MSQSIREARPLKRSFMEDSLELTNLRRHHQLARAEDRRAVTATDDAQADPNATSTTGALEQQDGDEETSELLSTLTLFLVAIIWGTNPVCLR